MIPAVRVGDIIPYGLSWLVGESYFSPEKITGLRLMLPFLPWHGSRYWFWDDTIIRGWWLFTFCIAISFNRSSMHLRIQWGSRPIGENKHLQIDPRK
jgi:hypothetical protein